MRDYNTFVGNYNKSIFYYLDKLQISSIKLRRCSDSRLWCKLIASGSLLLLRSACLKILNMESNQIMRIDSKAFFGLNNLKELYLQKNQISSLSSMVFHDLVNLKRLDLSANKINHIDKNICKGLVHLEYLSLNCNQIAVSELNSDTFQSLINLKYLGLTHNQIRNIDYLEEMAFVYNLRENGVNVETIF